MLMICGFNAKNMEENKYYVPEIDEFFVGFEFEEWENPAFTNEEWIAKKIEYFTDLEYICIPEVDKYLEDYVLGTSLFRVKHLDSEDLIELGFEYMEDVGDCINFAKYIQESNRSINLTLHRNSRRVGVAVHDLNVKSPMTSIQIGTFGGEIKNKSELIKVLKMLGIK